MRFLFLLFYYEPIWAQGLNQPKIQVMLIIKAQNGKDIHFVTTSGSNVYINGDDFGGISTRVDDHEKQLTQLSTNHCSSSPCHNGGTCINNSNGFVCQCKAGWTGSTCSEDFNECADPSLSGVICQNGGQCENRPPPTRFSCNCSPEYYGNSCSQKYNDCTQSKCGGKGTCMDKDRTQHGIEAYECVCFPGFELSPDGTTCIDIDECKSSPCYPGVQCKNIDGSYKCKSCPAGMTGDGEDCEYIDQCAIDNGGCDAMVTCTNTNPGRKCGSCPAGYVGNGVYCKKQSLCDSNNGGCSPMATCSESGGSVTCKCGPGYSGNGVGPDGCKQTDITCDLNCANGYCVVQNGKPACLCFSGYSGDLCDKSEDPCISNPCLNGGSCVSSKTDYECKCSSDWTGMNCEQPLGECGGEYAASNGTLAYPGGGNLYPNNAKCSWIILVNEGLVVNLQFTQFDLEKKSGQTCHDKLEVYDGVTTVQKPPLLGTYCGTDTPVVPESTHNSVELDFISDGARQGTGFTVQWTSKKGLCGGRISTPTGIIQSPGYPRACTWYIDVETTKVIEFKFEDFKLHNSPSCSAEYVQIFNGAIDRSEIFERTCGSHSNIPTLRSLGPVATVVFQAGQTTSTGFKLTYTTIDNPESCGGDLTDNSGTIMSPGFPNGYDHNMECLWKIMVKQDENIIWRFEEISIEVSSHCFDYIAVGYGLDNSGSELGLLTEFFCGFYVPDPENDALCDKQTICEPLPLPIYSLGNEMVIKFFSDFAGNPGRGFKGNYTTGCGGSYNQPGILSSPNYPDIISSPKNCTYSITASVYETINMHFNTFDLGSEFCHGSWLVVFDGPTADPEKIISQHCGNIAPDDIRSTSNEMTIRFYTDGTQEIHGFEASFDFKTSGCGDFYDAREGPGFIKSPGFPMPYPHDLNCTYTIQSEAGSVIELDFTSFNIEKSSSCSWDHLTIYDSDQPDEDALIGKFCGDDKPSKIFSTGQFIFMVFISDGSSNDEGWETRYEQRRENEVCGGLQGSSNGIIKSNGFPGPYPVDQQCNWEINLQPGVIISLRFTDFDLEMSDRCVNDYVIVYDGLFQYSPELGVFCGSKENGDSSIPPELIQSSSHQMKISFHSNNAVSGNGFSATYDGNLEGCGGSITAIEGKLHSPNYPKNYPSNAHCEFNLKTNPGNGVSLKFTDFNLMISNGKDKCAYDYIQIYEGEGITGAPLTNRLCESEKVLGIDIPTNSSSVTILFETDSSGEDKGWLMDWTTSSDSLLTEYVGIIQSHNYPGNYPLGVTMKWRIQGPEGHSRVTVSYRIHLVDWEIQENASDGNDKFSIFRNWDDQSEPWMSFDEVFPLGDIVFQPDDTHNGICRWMIWLQTDEVNAHRGINLEYSIDGGYNVLTDPSGTIMSNDFNGNGIERETTEIWTISIPNGRVQLTMKQSNLGTGAETYVDVYSGKKVSGNYLTRWTKYQSGAKTTSSGPDMTVMLNTNEHNYGNTKIKFSADYTSVTTGGCGHEYIADHGTIESPNYPKQYPPGQDCTWDVLPSADMTEDDHFVVSFTDFELESSSTCYYDKLEIYHTDRSEGNRLAVLCGTDLPGDIHAPPGKAIFIRFISDNNNQYKGFSLNWHKNCGGNILSDESGGYFTTGNYPMPYHSNTDCFWTIRTVPELSNEKIFLRFTHFDLYTDLTDKGNCNKGHFVQIYEGSVPRDEEKYCERPPPPYTSKGNLVKVYFNTQAGDDNVERTGFYAIYSAGVETCGGTIRDAQGRVMSPGFTTGAYPPNLECMWTLIASPGNKVEAWFNTMELEDTPDCSKDYLEIRELTSDGDILTRLCGSNKKRLAAEKIWLTLITDGDVSGRGFELEYEQTYGMEWEKVPHGMVSSPLYPNLYPPENKNVVWKINGYDGTTIIRYEILYFDLPCDDEIIIYDGPDNESPVLFRRCGQMNDLSSRDLVQETTQHQMKIRFRTDDNAIVGHGFQLSWQLMVKEDWDWDNVDPEPIPIGTCGFDPVIVGENPFWITSPGFPNDYAPSQDCYWHLTASQEHTVEFFLQFLDVEPSADCSLDYLAFMDGPYSDDPLIYRACGGKAFTPKRIRSSGRYMTILFHTDDMIHENAHRTGFNGTYYFACGGTRTADNGIISSPKYDGEYPADIDCYWMINMSPGHTVGIVFAQDHEKPFSIDGHGPYCNETGYAGDFVALYNGATAESPPLMPQTQSRAPDGSTPYHCGDYDKDSDFYLPDFTSTQSSVLVWFHSSDKEKTHGHRGFQLEYTKNSLACGSDEVMLEEKDYRGTIASPEYPQHYPANQYCVWTITAPQTMAVQLDFTAFSLPGKMGECTDDYVQIYDVKFNRHTPIATLCGQARPATQKTVGNQMNVKLYGTQEASGFEASYSLPDCGGLQTGSSGVVAYEEHYGNTQEKRCTYMIQANKHHSINFGFDENFMIPCHLSGGEYQSGSYIEILEYSSEGYMFLKDKTSGKYLTVDHQSSQKYVILADLVAEPTQYQLWYWQHGKFIRSVGLQDQTLAVQRNAGDDSPQQGKRVVVNDFVAGSNNQQWKKDEHGRISPATNMLLFVSSDKSHPSNVILDNGRSDSAGQIYDESNTNLGKQIGKFCGTQAPANFTSLGSEVIIYHYEDREKNNFTLYWDADEIICGGELTGRSGFMMSPNYPQPYDSSRRCTWSISVPDQNKAITVSFLDFDLKTSDNCMDHYVQFFDGVRPSSPALTEKLCRKPEDITSHGHQMMMVFETDYSTGSRGFYAEYNSDELAICGGAVDLPDGAIDITSPNYPNFYNSSTECNWVIDSKQPYNKTLKLTFDPTYHIEGNPDNCIMDRLIISLMGDYDNYHSPRDWYTFCGDKVPEPLGMPGQKMRAVFQSDDSNEYEGFKMNVEVRQCGGVFGGSSIGSPITGGFIASPNYPMNYPDDEYCFWLLVVPKDQIVGFKFTHFDLDGPTSHRPECSNDDWVDVINGPTPYSPKMGRYCSTNKPPLNVDYHSTGNEAIIIFKSDHSHSKSGFQMQWQAGGAECGNQIIQAETGQLTSPNYPSNYPDDANCIWTIHTTKGKHLVLTFSDFKLENQNGECQYDYLKVLDSDDSEIGNYCGNQIDSPINISRSKATLNFVSDVSINAKGFKMDWKTVCGENILDDQEGYVTNPNFGIALYAKNMDCTWNISSSNPTDLVKIQMKTLDIDGTLDSGCPDDYLAFYTGNTYIKKICGSTAGDKITARGNVQLRFVTDNTVEKTGWSADYSIGGCGGYFEGTSGKIDANAHNLEGLAPQKVNCTWIIAAEDTDKVIMLKEWNHFNIAYSAKCDKDYLKIYDGPDTSSDVIGTFCGFHAPRYIRSTGQKITLEFISAEKSEGFDVTWKQTLGPSSGCGGKITSTSGTFSSPVNPSSKEYYSELMCMWEIPIADKKALTVEFTSFDLEEISNGECWDYVEVIDGEFISDEVVFGPRCGHLEKTFVRAYNKKAYIIFVSDEFVEDKGFTVKYDTINNNCGGSLVANDKEQELHYKMSPNGDNTNCVYDITTDDDHYVHITPVMINFPASTEDYPTPITKSAASNPVVLLPDMSPHHVSTVKLKVDSPHGTETYFFFCPGTVYGEGCWAIEFNTPRTGEGDPKEVKMLYSDQLVTSQSHAEGAWENWKQGLEIRITDRSIGVFDPSGMEIIFFSSSAEFPVMRHEISNLIVSNSGSPAAKFTVTKVTYRTNKNEVNLVGQEIQVSKGNQIATIERFYKTYSFSVEIQVNEDSSTEYWKNIIQGIVFLHDITRK